MLHIALWEPEIPPNTGNIARLCAATGTRLHLIGPLGFKLDDKSLKRAGLDYWPAVDVVCHETEEGFALAIAPARIWCIEVPGDMPYTQAKFQEGDCLLFGKESLGLPDHIRSAHAGRILHIPMSTAIVRSLNLSTAAGIVLYEALRQLDRW